MREAELRAFFMIITDIGQVDVSAFTVAQLNVLNELMGYVRIIYSVASLLCMADCFVCRFVINYVIS